MRANERLSAEGQRLAPLVAALAHEHLGAGGEHRRLVRAVRKAYILTRMGQCENRTTPSPQQQLEELRAICGPHRGVCPIFDSWFDREEQELLAKMSN
jgi:hypothetical protein